MILATRTLSSLSRVPVTHRLRFIQQTVTLGGEQSFKIVGLLISKMATSLPHLKTIVTTMSNFIPGLILTRIIQSLFLVTMRMPY